MDIVINIMIKPRKGTSTALEVSVDSKIMKIGELFYEICDGKTFKCKITCYWKFISYKIVWNHQLYTLIFCPTPLSKYCIIWILSLKNAALEYRWTLRLVFRRNLFVLFLIYAGWNLIIKFLLLRTSIIECALWLRPP